MKISHLCTLKKSSINKNLKKIAKIVKKPKFICDKCARVAHDEEYLCNPSKLKS